MATKNKFPEWGRTEDGTEVRLCPLEKTNGKPLYCSRDGVFYSRRMAKGVLRFRRIVVNRTPPRDTRLCHTRYPFVRQYGSAMCHTLMALTWIGPRPKGYQCDHLNGDMLDWSADNLQWVTPAENCKRAKLLRVLRSIGRDPKQMSREELLGIFNHYEFTNPQNID